MGGRKNRRNTAKTGDKAIYNNTNKNKSHEIEYSPSTHTKKDDLVYDEVDRFHSDDYLRLDQNIDDDDDDDSDSDDYIGQHEEAVMDLGLGDDDDDDDDSNPSTSADDDSEGNAASGTAAAAALSSSDDDDDEVLEENVRDWGTRKSAYYYGDTADLEIGQDENDAVLEEVAAKEVLAARFNEMTEDDFVMSSDDEHDQMEDDQNGVTSSSISNRNFLKLSTKEKRKLLDKQHPEFLPLLTHFSKVVQDYHTKTSKVTDAIFFGKQGTADVSEVGRSVIVCFVSLFVDSLMSKQTSIHDRRQYTTIFLSLMLSQKSDARLILGVVF
jgi:hypothetical protein